MYFPDKIDVLGYVHAYAWDTKKDSEYMQAMRNICTRLLALDQWTIKKTGETYTLFVKCNVDYHKRMAIDAASDELASMYAKLKRAREHEKMSRKEW